MSSTKKAEKGIVTHGVGHQGRADITSGGINGSAHAMTVS